MTEKEKFAALKLALSENIGPMTYKGLIAYFKNPVAAVENLPNFLKNNKRRSIKIAPDSLVYSQFEMAEKLGAEILVLNSPGYPTNLKAIEDAPPVLFTIGNKSLFEKRCVAIVGSRSASLNGMNLTRKISFDLVKEDVTVVSGMAKGIDRAAHEGALKSDQSKGGTIAVLGTGIDIIYPRENADIYAEIKEKGLIISELPFASKPVPSAFPRRNRIISGLSLGTIVIEASRMSGSLITAKEALNQGREVFAVPGSPLDSRAAGPNQLIKDGAHLVTSVQDILFELNNNTHFRFSDSQTEPCFDFSIFQNNDTDFITEAREKILSHLSPEVTSIDELIRETGLRTELVNAILLEMELSGIVERFVGQRVSLVYNNEWTK